MYVRTDEGLGFSFSIPAQGVDIDFKKAVRLNRYYRKTLGWEKDYERILRLLGYATTRPPDEESFAQAVAFWQRNQSLKGKEVDGVIGPNITTTLHITPTLSAIAVSAVCDDAA